MNSQSQLYTLNEKYIDQCVIQYKRSKMGAHNKNLKIALGLQVVTFILIFLAFVLPYWLVADGKLSHPKFLNLGKQNSSE